MKINITYFGMIAEIVNCSCEIIQFDYDKSCNFRHIIEERYPEIAKIEYKIAINQQLTDSIETDHSEIEVALLPPFAGG
jgi:molybdopterin converting factor small subunit